jgi:hypothetical protein
MKTHGQPDPHATMRMSAGDPRAEILRLETEIEELTEVIERCRKIISNFKDSRRCRGHMAVGSHIRND